MHKNVNRPSVTVQDEIMMLKSLHADIVTKFGANGLKRRSVDQDEFVFGQSHVNLTLELAFYQRKFVKWYLKCVAKDQKPHWMKVEELTEMFKNSCVHNVLSKREILSHLCSYLWVHQRKFAIPRSRLWKFESRAELKFSCKICPVKFENLITS